MLVATGVASAAVERRKAGARRSARCRTRDGAELGWMAPIGAPPPFLFGGKRFVALIKTTRMRMHRENDEARFIRPRDSGGGPREAWWRGRLRRSFVAREEQQQTKN
jgi:hypothetical protein